LKEQLPDDVELIFEEDDSFWLICVEDDKKIKCKFDLRIFPGEVAKKKKVGEARSEANQEPYLPPPIGRLSFSLNPFKMFSQLVGADMRYKIYCYCCCIFCWVVCIAFFPLFFTQLCSLLFAGWISSD